MLTLGQVTEEQFKRLGVGIRTNDLPKPTFPQNVIGCYDLISQKYKWLQSFDANDKACRMGREGVAILSNKGRLGIVDSQGLKRSIDSGLTDNQLKSIRNIGCRQVGDAWLFVFNQSDPRSSSLTVNASLRAYRIISVDKFFSGQLQLIRSDGKAALWKQPVSLDGFAICPNVPAASPLLLFHRRIQPTSGLSQSVPKSQHVVGIDRRTGKAVLNELMPDYQVMFEQPIRWDPVKRQLEMQLAHFNARFACQNISDLPPAPVASVTRSNPIPATAFRSAPEPFDVTRLIESNKLLWQAALRDEMELEQRQRQEKREIQAEVER